MSDPRKPIVIAVTVLSDTAGVFPAGLIMGTLSQYKIPVTLLSADGKIIYDGGRIEPAKHDAKKSGSAS